MAIRLFLQEPGPFLYSNTLPRSTADYGNAGFLTEFSSAAKTIASNFDSFFSELSDET